MPEPELIPVVTERACGPPKQPLEPLPGQTYRVCWRSITSKQSGHGKPVSYEIAHSHAYDQRLKQPDYYHWVEAWPPVVPDQTKNAGTEQSTLTSDAPPHSPSSCPP